MAEVAVQLADQPPSFLPHFANDEVRALNDLVVQAQKELRDVDEAVEEQEERTVIMEQHMRRLEQEILQTQCRSDAKRREIATEEHLKKLAEMEVARIQRDLVRLQKESEETASSIRSLNSSILKANEKMEKFRLLMQWNKEELEQWAKAAEQKDEDDFALQMYSKSDNAKVKELYLEAERVSSEVCALQQALEAEVTSTQSTQIELDKTAEVFRTLHNERKELIKLWEESIETIHKRDESIHKAAEEFAKNKIQMRDEKRQLDDLAEKLAKEIQLISELKKQVMNKEEEAVKAQEMFLKEEASTKEAEEELVLMRRSLELAVAHLASLCVQKLQAEEDLKNKKEKVKEVSKKLEDTKHKVEEELVLLDTLDKKRKELERILTDEEAKLKAAKKEVNLVKERHFEASENLSAMCDKEKDTVHEIKGANAQSAALSNQIRQMEEKVLRLDELLYSTEFQIQCLERKVARASGERSDIEAKEAKTRLTELEKELQVKKSEQALVLSQIKKAEEDSRAAKRKNEELVKKVSDSNEKNSELTLASETGLQAIKGMVKQKEEKLLARDLLQMEVNRLQGVLNLKTDAVFGMEDMKQRLKMNMEERKEELQGRFKNQHKEIKALRQEIHCLSLKKKRLYLQCEKLQAKYETLLRRTKFEPGDKRSPQLLIANASKEQESMQQEGYNLEQQVQEVKEEIRALEGAVDDVKEANELLRHSYRSPKMKELADEQLQLKIELEKALESLHDRQKLEQSLLEEIAGLESSLQNLQNESRTVMEYLKTLEEQVDVAFKEAEEQNQKYKRAKAQLSKMTKEIKNTHGY
ncbi:hypothetical protein KP509_14G055900 [Ceratopteris richardii]|uniref:Coiled-coil domain-containing protein 39 n=1 Tax=Ceratopteris richardii TaxID=49495 RepID=A0A8T2TF20_CERRI|nr:hypothetical protein KP509_14G055900 [Ceratopteris richardii]